MPRHTYERVDASGQSYSEDDDEEVAWFQEGVMRQRRDGRKNVKKVKIAVGILFGFSVFLLFLYYLTAGWSSYPSDVPSTSVHFDEGGGEGEGVRDTPRVWEVFERDYNEAVWRRPIRDPPCECLSFPRCMAVKPTPGPLEVVNAADMSASRLLCDYMCPCIPVLITGVFDVWPLLQNLSFSYLNDEWGWKEGKTNGGHDANPFISVEENSTAITVGDIIAYVNEKGPRKVEGRYAHFHVGEMDDLKVLRPLFAGRSALFPEPSFITIGPKQSGNTLHDDGPKNSGFFCVSEGAKGYILYHQADFWHVCNKSYRNITYQAVFPGESSPRNFTYTISQVCVDVRYPREEQLDRFPTAMEATEYKTIVHAGECLFFPAAYLHGLWNDEDSIGANVLVHYDDLLSYEMRQV